MKKAIIAIVMAALCLVYKANAQDAKAIDVTAKGLQIGQKVPDVAKTYHKKGASFGESNFKTYIDIV